MQDTLTTLQAQLANLQSDAAMQQEVITKAQAALSADNTSITNIQSIISALNNPSVVSAINTAMSNPTS